MGLSSAYAEVDPKGWLKSPGSTSEWLESKNWNNTNWWVNSLASFYDSPKSKISQKIIDEARIKTCNQFIELYDFPRGLKSSCRSIYNNLPDRITRRFSKEQKAFYEDKRWDGERYSSSFAEKNSEILSIFNKKNTTKRSWFNKDYWDQEIKKQEIKVYNEKDWIMIRKLNACTRYATNHSSQLNEKNEFKNKFNFPTLGIYIDCLEARKSNAFNTLFGFDKIKLLKTDESIAIKNNPHSESSKTKNKPSNINNLISKKKFQEGLEHACVGEIFFDDCVI